jgi:hypothetical protein
MTYTLLENSQRGVLTDRTPVMLDMRDTYQVSFSLPSDGAYIALFRGEDGIEYKAAIRGGQAKVPKELLTKEQHVGLIVCKTDGDVITGSWECEPLKITAFLDLRQNQWELSGGLNDKSCIERLTELEGEYDILLKEFAALKALTAHMESQTDAMLARLEEERNEAKKALASHQANSETLGQAYNKAIEVINDLSKRLERLEKNYDPTIID